MSVVIASMVLLFDCCFCFHCCRAKVPGAHTCGSLSKSAIPSAVKYELQGKLQGHAESGTPPHGSTPFALKEDKDIESGTGETDW